MFLKCLGFALFRDIFCIDNSIISFWLSSNTTTTDGDATIAFHSRRRSSLVTPVKLIPNYLGQPIQKIHLTLK